MTPADLESALRTHQAMVYSIAYHFFGGSGVAEEAAQDVFMQLYLTPEPPRSAAHVTAWLRRVTVHRCIDLTRQFLFAAAAYNLVRMRTLETSA